MNRGDLCMRFMSPDEFREQLRHTIDDLCKKTGMSQGELAGLIHINRDRLSSYINENGIARDLDKPWQPRALIPAEVLARIYVVADRHKISSAEALMQEYGALMDGGFFKHPVIDPCDSLSIFEQLENLYAKNTKLSETLRSAWVDKKITPQELNAIVRAATANQAAGQKIIEWAQEKMEANQGN